MSLPYVLALDSPGAIFELAGGKGANLAHLIRAGFPVPGGFILTTQAYEDYVAVNDLAGFILATVGAAPANDSAAVEAASAAIRMRFAQGLMPAELARALRSAYGALELASVAVAVRSSATAEDLPDLSFAGQQDTFLNVVGEEALLQTVVDCWSSLWTARAISYRARNNLPHDRIALAVVVQAMVQSQASGVLFTANPLTGKRAEIVIDATVGLGEALVSGKIEPDHYVLDATGAILRKALGTKALAIHGQARGGTETVMEEATAYQALPDAAIAELAGLGRRVAELFGWPQDIEWAWADGCLWLLQARPITSLYPLPEGMPPDPLQVLISFGAVQGILDPFTPLGQDAICALLAGAANLFSGENRVTYATQRVAVSAGERLFLNITGTFRHGATRRIARAVPAFVEPAMGQAMSGLWNDRRLVPAPSRIRLHTLWRLAPVFLPVVGRFIATLIRPDARREQAQRYLEEIVSRIEASTAAASMLADRLACLNEALGSLPSMLTRWLPAFAPGMAMLNLLLRLSRDIPGGRQLVLEVTRGLPYNVTTEMDLALWDVARKIGVDPVARACIENVKVSTLAADALVGRLPPTAQTALDEFLAPRGAHKRPGYGMRGVGEIDIGRSRWREDPVPVIQAIRSYLRIDDPDQAPDVVFARGAASAEAALDRLCQELRAQRGGWVKARLARWAARRVRALTGLRESPKFAIVRVLSILRESLLVAGRELAAAGTVAQPGDVFFLRLGDLEALAVGGEGAPVAGLRETVAVRRERHAREMLRRQIPRLMLSDGQAFYEGIAAPEGSSEGVLLGSPVSPGVAEGAVRVVLDPHGASLAPGEILVCPGTDPAWTPLFLAAGGLVMETGGLMTHGAVVAREYGIPAVVGVTGATRRLITGQPVRVDGTGGLVTVLLGVAAKAGD